MSTFLATAALMGVLMIAMAIGVMFGRDELKGSCGGLAGKDCLCIRDGKIVGICEVGEGTNT
jgi:hypothetical protein